MTLINIILDRSGSMGVIGDEVVGMYNRFLDEQKDRDDYAELTLVQFDDMYEKTHNRKPIRKVRHLINGKTFVPRGMTALHDAIGKTITDLNVELKEDRRNRPKRVLFVIITDGHENVSKEFNGRQVQKLMDDQKEKYGWDFIFLGAGIDAKDEGNKFGMDMRKCASFQTTDEGFMNIGGNVIAYTNTYRSTGDNSKSI
jgi:hypothetical protein